MKIGDKVSFTDKWERRLSGEITEIRDKEYAPWYEEDWAVVPAYAFGHDHLTNCLVPISALTKDKGGQ